MPNRVDPKAAQALVDKYAGILNPMNGRGIRIKTTNWEPLAIQEVYLDYSDEEWVGMLNKEGPYLGVCCAAVSEVRDILFGAVREGKKIECPDLCRAVHQLENHGHGTHGPASKLKLLWECIKEDACGRLDAYPTDPNDLQDAIEMVTTACGKLSWNYINAGPETMFRQEVAQYWEFMRISPAIRTLYKSLDEFFGGKSVDGYALCRDGQVVEFATGVEVYADLKTAERNVKDFRRLRDCENLTIRKVKLSLQDGLEYLD